MKNAVQATVQVVIPARNEADCLGRCLASLVTQTGIDFAITVVDDGSTDSTRAIAESFPGVRVLSADEPAPGVSGKCNALIQGVKEKTATWLLFTDADTYHHPGSLAAAVAEAEERNADLLSFSPEQETGSLGERALMPLVFADLARTYPPQRVNDPSDPLAAANGQYLLVRREVYESLGGHCAVANKILEDVELARLFKAAGHNISFRQGDRRVSARMYRDFAAMVEGWTKNLALLFPNPLRLAAIRSLEFAAILASLTASGAWWVQRDPWSATAALAVAGVFYAMFFRRVLRAHFPPFANLLSFFGLPLFAWLLVRSWLRSRVGGAVTWKGRQYRHSAPERSPDSSITGRS
jgi:glycosyltransferase involved in cell wall biosynthesis